MKSSSPASTRRTKTHAWPASHAKRHMAVKSRTLPVFDRDDSDDYLWRLMDRVARGDLIRVRSF